MSRAVKGAAVWVTAVADGCPFLRRGADKTGGIVSVVVKRAVVQHDVIDKHRACAEVLCLSVCTVYDIAEEEKLLFVADIIGISCGAETLHADHLRSAHIRKGCGRGCRAARHVVFAFILDVAIAVYTVARVGLASCNAAAGHVDTAAGEHIYTAAIAFGI